MSIDPQMADINVDNQRADFNTGPYGDPLKIKILKFGFVHARKHTI